MNTASTPKSLLDAYGSPLYVYDAETIKTRYNELASNITWPKTRIHYACKANTNIEILKLLKSLGAGIETVSEGEVRAAKAAGFAPEDILFTCSNVTEAELKAVVAHGVTINADSLGQMEKLARISPGIAIGIRINQGIGAGHHDHVITGGPRSKFGIPVEQVGEAQELAKKLGITICGVHQHIGSNVLDEDVFIEAVRALLKTAGAFPDLTYIDFGGGFGIPYRPEETRLDIPRLGARIAEEFKTFCTSYGKELSMRFEAGRYLVAESGTLLVTVTDIKKTPAHTFVGVDSGFNHLIRPAMYGAYHVIETVTHPDAERAVVTIAGNVCESGDVFAEDREIAMPIEGDILGIRNAGAYGFTMASTYNSRPLPAEVLIEGETPRLIRERGELRF
jgi:diaminopimelate decarboxylase